MVEPTLRIPFGEDFLGTLGKIAGIFTQNLQLELVVVVFHQPHLKKYAESVPQSSNWSEFPLGLKVKKYLKRPPRTGNTI